MKLNKIYKIIYKICSVNIKKPHKAECIKMIKTNHINTVLKHKIFWRNVRKYMRLPGTACLVSGDVWEIKAHLQNDWSCCFGPSWRFQTPPAEDWTVEWCLLRAVMHKHQLLRNNYSDLFWIKSKTHAVGSCFYLHFGSTSRHFGNVTHDVFGSHRLSSSALPAETKPQQK